MLFFWHAIMAYFIWAWVVRERDVGTLQSRIPLVFGLAAAVSAGVTVIPIYNNNLGLWPHRYARTIHRDCCKPHKQKHPQPTDQLSATDRPTDQPATCHTNDTQNTQRLLCAQVVVGPAYAGHGRDA